MNTNTAIDTMDTIRNASKRVMNEALNVMDGIKKGEISLNQATEMSNAMGKANAAIGNILKIEVMCMTYEKISTKPSIEGDDTVTIDQ